MPRTFILNKLVPQGVYDSMIALGQQPRCRKLSDKEFDDTLTLKLSEEATEYAQERTDAESHDVKRALYAIGRVIGSMALIPPDYTPEDDPKGEFKPELFVGRLTLQDGDEWIDYYASDPVRFPEVLCS